jgi:hypothetical protein
MFGLSDVALKIAGATLGVIAVFGFGYYKGHHSVQVEFDQYKTEVIAAATTQTEDTARKDAKTAKLITETKNAYNTELANLRAYYRLRVTKGGGTVSEVSGTSGGVDGYSPDNLPPTPVLAAQCAETTLTLIKLQEFNANASKTLE